MDHTTSPFAPDELLDGEATKQKLLAAFVAYVGGPDVLRWMQKHYGEGYSYYQLAEWDDQKPSTIRYRVRRAAKIMKEHGLFPGRWMREDELQRLKKGRRQGNHSGPAATWSAVPAHDG